MSEWIPVSERLPTKYETVLMARNGHRSTGFLGDRGWRWDADEPPLTGTPSHWMTLPAAPEALRKPEYPQHCTTPEPCIAAGRCTRDPNCID